MTQFQTTRYIDRGAPGHMITGAGERETEPAAIPFALQQLTLTFGGTDPAAVGAYIVTIPLLNGSSYSWTYTSTGLSLALTGPDFADDFNADPVLGRLYYASAVGPVVTLIAKSGDTSIPAANWNIAVPGATTLVAAQTVAAGSASLRMGVLMQAGSAPAGLVQGITGGPTNCVIAAALTDGMSVNSIRGMVAREANSTQMSPFFTNDTPDQYLSGQTFPVLLRGEGYVVIDPASAEITTSTANVYAVLPSGTGTIVGALTTVSTNNLLVNSGGNPFLRVVGIQETPVSQSPGTRIIACKLNRSN